MSNLIDLERERDKALLSLDKETILAYMRKYGIGFTTNSELSFWALIHGTIFGLDSATPEQKDRSMQWLITHGFKSDFRGHTVKLKEQNRQGVEI